MCLDILERIENDTDFMKSVISGDDLWISEYVPETTRQSEEFHTKDSPRPKKARKSKSKIKSMLITFFDIRGIVHKEFVPRAQILNQTYYRQALDRLRKRVRPDTANSWMIH